MSMMDPAEKLRLIVEEMRLVDKENIREAVEMLHPLEIEELERRASQGEVVIPGGTGGKSLEAQIQLAEGKETIVLSKCPIAQNLSFPQDFTTPPCWALSSTCLMSASQ
jgi:hypothetical protein